MTALSRLLLRPIRCYSMSSMSMYVDTSKLKKYPITLSLKDVHFTPIVPICNYYYIDSPNANHLNFINYSF